MPELLIGLLFLFSFPVIIVFVVLFTVLSIEKSKYRKSAYYENTQKGFFQVRFDKGAYGEYLTYKYLSRLTPPGYFLFNIYLPKDNGETTEIDVILIHQSGLYIFESKNYSGWIFGSETQRQWTQTLPNGRKSVKNHFLNPIMQNELHIKWLRNILSDDPNLPLYSYILFSDRCTLKNIKLTSNKARIINRYQVYAEVNRNAQQIGAILSIQQMRSILNRLFPYSKVTKGLKQQHIENIKMNHSSATEIMVQKISNAENETTAFSGSSANPSAKVCPRCGKAMVVRTAKKGNQAGKQFWGCTGYPTCRYIENL